MNVAVKENPTKESLKENLNEIFEELPVETLAEVVDFAEFLREKKRCQQSEETKPKERFAGLNKGEIWMSEDFNDELPEEFWLGEDFGIMEKNKNESADR